MADGFAAGTVVKVVAGAEHTQFKIGDRGVVEGNHQSTGARPGTFCTVRFDGHRLGVFYPEDLRDCGKVARKTMPDKPGWWWAIRPLIDSEPYPVAVFVPEGDDELRWYVLGSPRHNPLSEAQWLGPVHPTPLPMPFEDEPDGGVEVAAP